mmetsp:Transcript_30482/g.68458  ORF Transcript_30482/g.68458 Transcript_30482/m.68458 type:complete len:298 (-) Transcript_30482:382-1275(-)
MAHWLPHRGRRSCRSRPTTGKTDGEMQDFLQNVHASADAGSERRTLLQDNFRRVELQVALGPLRKTGKMLTDHTAVGGLVLKLKACRNEADSAAKALAAENIARLKAETDPGWPTVRTVCRLTDHVSLTDQTRSSAGDDLDEQIIASSSASFMNAVMRLQDLREEARATRAHKQEKADNNLSKVAYESMYGLKKAKVAEEVLDPTLKIQARRGSSARRRSSYALDRGARRASESMFSALGSPDDEEESTEEDLEDSLKKFDKWVAKHLRKRRRQRGLFRAPTSPLPIVDMSLVGIRP